MAEAAQQTQRRTTHLVTGGFPRGALAGHDMDYARLRLLQFLSEHPQVTTTVAADFGDITSWLERADSLVTYVAGPFPNDTENAAIRSWLEAGGRWFALHGTSGGKAARIEGSRGRRMVKTSHHETLGAFFLNHPPLRRFTVSVTADHPLARDVPTQFDVADELYLIEPQGDCEVLLTTELEKDPSPPGFGFTYDTDTSVQGDGKTRILGYTRPVGAGGVTYIALGHCHSPASNMQPFVDDNLGKDTPPVFHGAWEVDAFQQLVRNAIAWSVHAD